MNFAELYFMHKIHHLAHGLAGLWIMRDYVPTTPSFDTYYTSFHTKGQTNISLPFIMANSCTTYDDIKYADKCKVDTTIRLDEVSTTL